jgi:hypothetical protein
MQLLAYLCVSASLALTQGLSGGTDPIVIKPVAGKTGVDKVLIVINGALVPNTDYVDVAKAVQAASDLKLWVAIPSFVLNTPNPGQIGSKITGAISELEKSGFPGTIKADSDVIVAGHSLGGIFSQTAVVSGGYAGLVLLGSYLTGSTTVSNYKKPALTLAGELDGLTRITRIAKSYSQLQDRISADGEGAKYKYPVVALPGQSHSQFCSNVNVTSFGMKDKCPEVSLADAHAAIGSTVSAFLDVLWSTDNGAAKTKLDSGMEYTKSLVSGYLAASKSTAAGDWCAHAQKQEALLLKTDVSVDVKTTSNFASFDATNPSIAGNKVTAVQELQYKLNPTDLSSMDLSAQEIDCKVKTAAALAKAMGKSAPAQDSNTCQSVNDQAIKNALDLVTPATKQRYLSIMQQLTTDNDEKCSTGPGWQSASLNFDSKSGKISSPRLTTNVDDSLWPGSQLCKYLSPDRVIEYMMIDGLPSFDACPKKHSSSVIV